MGLKMTDHVERALYIYSEKYENYIESVRNNPFGVHITATSFTAFISDQAALLVDVEHVVVSGPLQELKTILNLAMQYGFSIGLLAIPEQKDLINGYGLPKNLDEAIDLALQKDAQIMDIILCNKKILLFKATIGRLPLLDSPQNISLLRMVALVLKNIAVLKLLPFSFTTANDRQIETAACGCTMPAIIGRRESSPPPVRTRASSSTAASPRWWPTGSPSSPSRRFAPRR